MKKICVLVTGGTGFLGKNLLSYLVSCNMEVHAIVRDYNKVKKLSKDVQEKVIFHKIERTTNIRDMLENIPNKPSLIYHLAAKVQAVHTYDDIRDMLESNIIFGTQLLDAMCSVGIKNFINTGTFWQHYNDEIYNPVDLYAASKQGFEDIIKFYEESNNLKVINLHLFDNYGLNDDRRKIIPLLIQALKDNTVIDMSNGEQLMNMVYVDDVIKAFKISGDYLLKKRYDLCGTYAVSADKMLTLRDLVAIIEKKSGKKIRINWGALPYRKREVMIPWKSGKRLPDWKSNVSFSDGIDLLLKDAGIV